MAEQRITPMCHDWMAIPHQKLYEDIHGGTGTAAVEAAQDFYQQLQRGYQEVMTKLQDGLSRLAEAHQGQAADASQGAVSGFGDWVDQAAGVAGDDQSGVTSFSTSFASAKNAMPEAVQVTAVDSTWDNIKDFFGGTTAREAQEQAAREAHIEAARVMATFSESGTGAANGMPYWASPRQVAFDVPVPPPGARRGIAEGGGAGGSGGGASAGTVGAVAAVPQVTDPASVPSSPAGGAAAAGGASAVPTAPAAGTGAGAGGVGPAAGTVLPVTGSGRRAGRGGAGGAGSDLAAGAPRFGTGARGTTGGGRVGGGAGGRVGGPGGSGGLRPGGSTGAAPGGPGGAAAAAGRGTTGAGAAGRAGAGMVPFGAGGGRGHGGEDSEHQRKVPIHGEQELFADDRKTAPPVIGEDPPK